MRWLIITTNPAPNLPNTAHQGGGGWNIGDVFARIGTEQVIREVDPSAEFDLLNMDDHADVMRERAFDRCVFAGRPLFWKDCETYPEWTHVLNSWPGRDKRKIAALGVGDCYALPRDYVHLRARLADAREKVWGLWVRFAFDTEAARLSVCPSAWVLLDRPEKQTRKLCNFMSRGGHYPEGATREADLMALLMPAIADVLLERSFDFIAHSQDEWKFARAFGWPDERIVVAGRIDPYLDAYASASHYIGNRMHGAVILAGRNARALAVGYDSRLGMVSRAGCEARKPSELSLQDVIRFAESEPGEVEARRVRMTRGERKLAVERVGEFSR